MATRGQARQITVECLGLRKPFKRQGFGMSAVSGAVSSTGRMPAQDARDYERDRPEITYTVLSYATPIGWVLLDGTVKVPDVHYSQTTRGHQGLCRTYLGPVCAVR